MLRHTRRVAAYGRTVGLGGIIYCVIVVAWLCYLVPLALRRHDEAARTRSVDRFSSAMRVLGRTDATTPAAAPPSDPVVRRRTLAAAGPGGGVPAPAARPGRAAAARRAARVAAARRRRVLVVLLVFTATVTGLAVAALVPVWAPGVPAAVVVGFLVVARLQVSRARTHRWESSLRTAATTRTVVPIGEPDDAPTVVLDAVADDHPLEQQQVVAAAVTTVDGTSLWDPLPVTLPTYVSKPRAERSIRTVDLNSPGAWTSGHLPGPGSEDDSAAGSEAGVGAAPRAVGD